PAPTQAMPLQGPTRYETAVEVSQQSFPDGADAVVIATGENWPDALAGASFAGAVGAPILLVGDMTADMCAEDLPQAVADEIERLGASSVYILGGEKAIAAGVQSDIESITGEDAMRFAGMDRYETACVVASETVGVLGDEWDGTAFATTGRNWPDALAAAPLAAFAGYPVFLADADGMSDDTEACMDELGVTGTIVLGGTVAMPLSVTAQMQSLGIVEIDRVGGDTRYETAALISQFGVDELGMSFDTLGISTGTRFPDALASGAALGQEGFTTMLTPGTYLHAATMAALEGNADDICRFIDVEELIALWDDLVLPPYVRRAWAAWFRRHGRSDLAC
ncbi:MAG: cell wall-binding repeat-containing protein, partial [Actinomycetota bacterium]|nr:cell wall-binding repeat-containing protein [Actinomycetota bacterium]